MTEQLMLECFGTKPCKDCGGTKAFADFYRDRQRKDGLSFYCKPCTMLRHKVRHAKNPEPARARALQWRIDNPERKRAADAKYRGDNPERCAEVGARWRRENKDRAKEYFRNWFIANRERHYEYSRRWREQNPDTVREVKRRWKQANKDVVRLHGANRRARERALTTIPFTAEQLAQKWAYHGNKCWICHGAADSTDHVKPVAKDGAHMLCNLRPVCRPCNSSKCDKWPFPMRGV